MDHQNQTEQLIGSIGNLGMSRFLVILVLDRGNTITFVLDCGLGKKLNKITKPWPYVNCKFHIDNGTGYLTRGQHFESRIMTYFQSNFRRGPRA